MQRTTVTTAHHWLQLEDDRIALYNHWDCYATALIYKALRERLDRNGQLPFWEREWWPCAPAVLAMQRRGLAIDAAERTRLRRQFRAEVRVVDRYLCEQAGQPPIDLYSPEYDKYKGFKPNSDTQVRRWLFGGDRTTQPAGTPVEINKGTKLVSLGLKPAGQTDTHLWSVDKDNLTRVLRGLRKMDEPHLPILLALLHRIRAAKLDEYLDFPIDPDGRVRPTVKMSGTETLRFAYADPAVHSWAADIRSMVVAAPGYQLVKADYSQLEARLAAYLSRDEMDIAIYERTDPPPRPHHPDWDIHARLICDGLSLSTEQWFEMDAADRSLHRDAAKNIRYGTFQYGGQPETASGKLLCPCGSYPALSVPWQRCKPNRLMDLSPSVKRTIVDGWRSLHTPFVQWQRRISQQVSQQHYLVNPLGFKRYFSRPPGPDLEREAYAWSISSTGSVIKLRALRRLHAMGVPVVFDHHDALMAEVPDDRVEWAKAAMREAMEEPVPELGGVRFPVDVGAGRAWSDLH